MMVPDHLFRKIKNSLEALHYRMNDSWLRDCVQFYIEQHQQPTQEEIVEFASTQLILSDLREVSNEKPALPPNLKNVKHTILKEIYFVQVEKIYDISTSKYKQLEKIRNVSTDNIEATEQDNKTQVEKTWEPKPKRVLQLFITDGVQDILAMEYHPILCLNDTLIPGYKILIKGPVSCRRGVVLLEACNIRKMGGEVESLLISNAVENVFARALNMAENPNPDSDRNKGTNQVTKNQNNALMSLDDDIDFNLDEITQIERDVTQPTSVTLPASTAPNPKERSSNTNHVSLFGNNLSTKNYSTLPSTVQPSISSYQNKKETSTSDLQNSSSKKYATNQEFHNSRWNSSLRSTDQNNRQISSIKIENNSNEPGIISQFDDDDDGIFDMIDENNLLPASKSHKLENDRTDSKPTSSSSNLLQKAAVNISSSIVDLTEDSEEDKSFELKNDFKKDEKINLPSSSTNSENQKSKKPELNFLKISTKHPSPPNIELDLDYKFDNPEDIHFDDDFEEYDFNNITDKLISNSSSQKLPDDVKNKEKTSSSTHKKLRMDYSINDTLSEQSDESFKKYNLDECSTKSSEKNSLEKVSSSGSLLYKTSHGGVKRSIAATSPPHEAPQPKRSSLNSAPGSSKNQSILNYFQKTPRPKEEQLCPCEFLCKILSEPFIERKKRRIIKIKELKSLQSLKLTKAPTGRQFSLSGNVSDGSGTLRVIFSSQLLEKIIGYSPEEFSVKRKMIPTNPEMKSILEKELRVVEDKLKRLHDIIEIEFHKEDEATIFSIREPTREEEKIIHKELKRLQTKA